MSGTVGRDYIDLQIELAAGILANPAIVRTFAESDCQEEYADFVADLSHKVLDKIINY